MPKYNKIKLNETMVIFKSEFMWKIGRNYKLELKICDYIVG